MKGTKSVGGLGDRLRAGVRRFAEWIIGLPRPTLILLLVLLAAGLAVTGLFHLAGEILEAVADRQGIALWDRPVLDWAMARRTGATTTVLMWFTNSGGPIWQPIIMMVISLLLWWRWRNPTPVVLVLLVQIGAVLISTTTKGVIGRPRPPVIDAVPPYETSPSFPSGHSLQAFAAATIVCYLLIRHIWNRPSWQRVLIALLGLGYAATMAFSRVYLGYHWLTDVLAAALLGLAWALIVIACHRVWRTIRKRREGRPVEADGAPPS
ncbi:phosphatase PAP2 family protein [Enemella sp. A6]|uniref:phosphatase PAP2 family protein n=1 Tax=Enemella sp. A6 TaxID=3440152 RepID=UPI003EBE8EBB